MQEGTDFRQFVFKVAEAKHIDKKILLRFRETLDTAVLGTLSTSAGVVVSIIGFKGILGFSASEWHEHLRDNPIPFFTFGIGAIIGEALGAVGLALGLTRGVTISPLCAAGTIVCLIQMFLFFGKFLLISFF